MRHRTKKSGIKSTAERLRLSVFRSNQHIMAQVINDQTGNTIVQASSYSMQETASKSQKATVVGQLLATRAKEKAVTQVAFDRGNRVYSGRIKALADAARAGGLDF